MPSIYQNTPFSVKHKKKKNDLFPKFKQLTKNVIYGICVRVCAHTHLIMTYFSEIVVDLKNEIKSFSENILIDINLNKCICLQQNHVDRKSKTCVTHAKKALHLISSYASLSNK